MKHSLTFSEDRKPDFPEWLAQRHGTTSRELHDMFRATGSWNDYQKAMAYLRECYRQDMAYREALLASNPFAQKDGTRQEAPDA
ncbi:MAG: hypothetical protein NC399_11340 [Muribaculum sp.]|nr:hypothetical protein [Muribaculum sp.]